MSDDVTKIVAELGPAQRRGLLSMEPKCHYPYPRIYGSTRCRLFMAGLLHCVTTDVMELTPLGERVRERLLELAA